MKREDACLLFLFMKPSFYMNQKQEDKSRRRHLKTVIPVMLIVSAGVFLIWSFALKILVGNATVSQVFYTLHDIAFLMMIGGMAIYSSQSIHRFKLFRWLTFMFMGYLHFTLFFSFLTRALLFIFENIMSFQLSDQNEFYLCYGVILSCYVFAVWQGHRFPKFNNIKLDLSVKTNHNMQPLKIVHLSDIHIGMLHINKKFIQRLVAEIQEVKPDLIFLTGDLVEASYNDVHEWVDELGPLTQIADCFYVTGNHEYYHGGDVWSDKMSSLGWTHLLNEHKLWKNQIYIAGVTDCMAGKMQPGHESKPLQSVQGMNPQIPTLFLAHEPKSLLELETPVDLAFTGHTHGGQLFPFNLLVPLQQPAVAGLHRIKGSLTYIHQGTGFWGPPLRFLTRSEAAVFHISPVNH